jgi:hypothetical protein
LPEALEVDEEEMLAMEMADDFYQMLEHYVVNLDDATSTVLDISIQNNPPVVQPRNKHKAQL